jgi:hypothetical protein
MLGNASRQKCGDFQQFCKLWKPLENYLGAFAQRRAWVRIPSAPLQNFLQTTKKLKILVFTPGRCAAAVPQPE